MKEAIQVRLCGGPFDGERDEALVDDRGDPPPRIWVRRCAVCREAHWEDHAGQGGEVYRRDCEEDGWHIYIFTDAALDGGNEVSAHEKVPEEAMA